MHVLLFAAAAAQTFNLACAGTETNKTPGNETVVPYTHIYRIDLGRGVYCQDRCDSLRPIANIQPTRLELENRAESAFGEKREFYNIINRETGEQDIHEVSDTRLLGFIYVKSLGKCERRPFTEFPTFQTKF